MSKLAVMGRIRRHVWRKSALMPNGYVRNTCRRCVDIDLPTPGKVTMKFCGMNDETGLATICPPDKVGYCGTPESMTALGLENGIWVCHADSEVMEKD